MATRAHSNGVVALVRGSRAHARTALPGARRPLAPSVKASVVSALVAGGALAVAGGGAYGLWSAAAPAANSSVTVGQITTSVTVPSLSGDLYPGNWAASPVTVDDTGSVGAGSVTVAATVDQSALTGSSGMLWWAFACPGGSITSSGSGTSESFSCSSDWVPIGPSAPSCFGSAMTPEGCLGGSSGWMADYSSAPWDSDSASAPAVAGSVSGSTETQESIETLDQSQVPSSVTLPTGTNSHVPVLVPSGGSLQVLLVEMLAPNSPNAAQGLSATMTWNVTLGQRAGALRQTTSS